MKIGILIKAVCLYLIGIFLVLFIFNLLLGDGGSIQRVASLFQPSFYGFFPVLIYFLFLVAIFVSNFEPTRKKKLLWLFVLVPLVYRAALFLIMMLIGGYNSWGFLGAMIYGGVEIAVLVIVSIIMHLLLSLENNKQNVTVFIIFVVLFLLNIIQWFGILRPGLIE